ncbi:Oidioi.mRNA.OKI2018_I69.PAR.g10327.t1.cds [Oikopleura dioica]|uniref:Oidioi.mRNA.OKI2018_I69.PAR.g10327.t1.cds n=1 Tax=Oikopleura dioica TaxID=34765 RepID=A0ABN7RR05_OIKDI|nr:Oidioi.mRNA.OKI2018_I69.PAR.g10327.t1.cds [Oikopleura dioica]
MITEFPVTDAKPLTKFHTFFSSDPRKVNRGTHFFSPGTSHLLTQRSAKNEQIPEPPMYENGQENHDDDQTIIKRELRG